MQLKYSNSKRFRFLLAFDLLLKIVRGIIFKIYLIKSSGFVAIGKNVKIYGDPIIGGKQLKIEDNCFLQSVSVDGILLGNNVTISNNVIIRPSGYYGGLLGRGLSMGNNSSIGAFSYIGCSGRITIGNYVMIGPRCTMIAENHVFSDISTNIQQQGVVQKGIIIEDNVWIGACVTILDGVNIKSGCIIAAGAVVTRDTMKNGIYAGIPAKRIKDRL